MRTKKGSSQSERRIAWDEAQLAATLQGLANRKEASVYLMARPNRQDKFWLDWARRPGGWLENAIVHEASSPDDLLEIAAPYLRGAVIWDENVPATANVATTVAGALGLVPIRFDNSANSMFTRLVRSGRLIPSVWLVKENGKPLFTGKGVIPSTVLPSTGSAKCDAYLWAMENIFKKGKCEPRELAYYPDAWWIRHPALDSDARRLYAHDLVVARKGFMFDLNPWKDEVPRDDRGQRLGTDFNTRKSILSTASRLAAGDIMHASGFTPAFEKYSTEAGGKHEPAMTEWEDLRQFSSYNAYMSGAPTANGSFWQYHPLGRLPRQSLPSLQTLRERELVDQTDRTVSNRTFISFYMGDYDGAWIDEYLPTLAGPEGQADFPLSWGIAPSSSDGFPPGLLFLRENISSKATIVAGAGGAGYLNPCAIEKRPYGDLPKDLGPWAKFSANWYDKTGLDLTGFLVEGSDRLGSKGISAFAGFSPAGVMLQYPDSAGMHGNVPFLDMNKEYIGPWQNPQKGANAVISAINASRTRFHAFRVIIWSPKQVKEMAGLIRSVRKDVAFVNLHELMLLYRQSLK